MVGGTAKRGRDAARRGGSTAKRGRSLARRGQRNSGRRSTQAAQAHGAARGHRGRARTPYTATQPPAGDAGLGDSPQRHPGCCRARQATLSTWPRRPALRGLEGLRRPRSGYIMVGRRRLTRGQRDSPHLSRLRGRSSQLQCFAFGMLTKKAKRLDRHRRRLLRPRIHPAACTGEHRQPLGSGGS